AARTHEDRRAHGLATGMLEHDGRVLADERPDVLAEPPPLTFVLGVLVAPEAVAGRLSVEHVLDAELVQQLDLVGRGHDPDGASTAVQHVLARVAAEPAG